LAKIALKKGTGARALRGIVEKMMLNVMYDIPDFNYISCTITEDVVNGMIAPILIRKDEGKAA
jgi:ATP-dependent Clp protease ATP-binding subunit ClpX